MNNDFDQLRKKYSNLILLKKEEIAELDLKLRVLADLEKDSAAQKNQQIPAGVETKTSKYASTSLTEAAKDAVEKLWEETSKPQSRRMIQKYITDNGFQATGKHFPVSVDQTLSRLTETKRLNTQLDGTRRVYCPFSTNAP